MELLERFVKAEKLTWAQVKAFCESLTAEELSEDVLVWGDEKGGMAFAISRTNDDAINPSGDGLEPVSFYANSEDPDDREIAEYEPVVMKKGSIILEVDF